jgi:hypothetical protein
MQGSPSSDDLWFFARCAWHNREVSNTKQDECLTFLLIRRGVPLSEQELRHSEKVMNNRPAQLTGLDWDGPLRRPIHNWGRIITQQCVTCFKMISWLGVLIYLLVLMGNNLCIFLSD